MEHSPVRHRPGVLLADESGLVLADLDSGAVRRLDGPVPAAPAWPTLPELAPLDGPLPGPVPAIAPPAGPAPGPDAVLAVDGPVALRLDGGRVLAWDASSRMHVELGPPAVELLRRCGTGRPWPEVAAGLGPDAPPAAAALVALGLLQPVDRPAPGPSAAGEQAATPGPSLAERAAAVAVVAGDRRVPVIPLYRWSEMSHDEAVPEQVEPSLSIGMLFAMARAHDGGRLGSTYDLRRLQPDAEAVLEAWAQDPRPAVFVFSDYLWNVDAHLRWSERVKSISPDSICLHGGPSVPKYEEDAERFFAEHPSVDVAARGEGEVTFVELLEALDGRMGAEGLERLRGVPGLTVRIRHHDTEELVRNPERERLADLDVIPSPFLTGEFDDLLSKPWRSTPFETNRGCPYGCTFCDWGSATLSRIRRFDLDRLKAELDWIFTHAAPAEMFITDANVGIFERDVAIAEHLAELRQRTGAPSAVVLNLAKNTAKYSRRIIQTLTAAGIQPITASSAVQSFDPATLVAVRRQNISLEKYDEIAVTFQEVGLALATDLLMGLPGATLSSFADDLQECFDREVTPRTMEVILLPNSPMNDPGYREQYRIRTDDRNTVVETSTYTAEDYAAMKRLRHLYRGADHFGVLRHVLRFLQWDHGLRAMDVLRDLDRAVADRGNRYPLLAFFARTFDLYTVPPTGWEPFYEELVEFLVELYDLDVGSDLATALLVQQALMPTRTGRYPVEIELPHDFVAYRRDRDRGRGTADHRPLASYGPGALRVDDPAAVSRRFVKRNDFSGLRSSSANLFWMGYDWELDSPLLRHLATNVGRYEAAPV